MCDTPIYVQSNQFAEKIPVPCGRCPPCLKRRVDSWVFRLMEEDKVSSYSHFVTLTYDTDHVPISDNGFMTLRKCDFQKFMKRLRKQTGIENIRYYACGEYGERYERPHYHAIIFNVPAISMYAEAWALQDDQGDKVGFGQIDVGSVSGDSIAYCCKYMDKQKKIPKHKRDDREKEFSLMSKGLGGSYLSKQVCNYHVNHIDQLYLTKKDGHKIAMPKYYRDKIFSDFEKSRQLHIVKDAMDKQESEDRLNCEKQGLDYHRWLEQRSRNRYARFNKSRSKNRNKI